jgi:RNA polymerase sigma factor (sigma-70 family)
MANEALRTFLRHLRRVADLQGPDRPGDAELLERFAVARDQAAFEVLVWRHGPMVLNLCRRMLRHEHDAEDAFQATFLALVRKAGSIAKREAVGSWLYKVAYRVALEASARNAQRATQETAHVEMLAAKPSPDLVQREFQLALGEEVNRLPDKYRVPLVLHCFGGKTSQEVAEQLGCAEATVRTRLARARERLRTRLVKRGLALSGGILAAGLSPGTVSAVPGVLIDLTVKAAAQFAAGNATAAGVVSANAAVLAERVVKLMFLNQLKQVAAIVVLVGVFGSGAGITLRQAFSDKPAVLEKEQAPKLGKETSQPKDDRSEVRGTWETWTMVTRGTGRETFPPELAKSTYVITEDKIQLVGQDGYLQREQSYKLDPTQKPKVIDVSDRITATTLLGIYELAGDALRIRYGRDKRPTDFSAELQVFHRVSRDCAPVPQRYANAPGCFWIDEPRANPGTSFGLGGVGMNYLYDKEPDGAAVITMAYLTPERKAREYRPVLVDAGGKRYLPKPTNGMSSGGRRGEGMVVLCRWRMDPNVLPAGKVAGLGIEAVTPESRVLVAREAQERAKRSNIEVLPWPQFGQPYALSLTAIDGQKVQSEDLKGKVVLIHCWSTNSGPDRWMMPHLKTLYEKWHAHGLEIVGIARNGNATIVRKVCIQEGLTWPQVLVPDGNESRELWQQACGIEDNPQVLILDQQGVLQADSTRPLEERIAKFLTNSSGQHSAKPKP